jgi:hypothetical protein
MWLKEQSADNTTFLMEVLSSVNITLVMHSGIILFLLRMVA